MGRRSTVARLDPQVREAVDRAVREGRATIDEVVELVDGLGGSVSRSAMGRYVKTARERLKRWKESQEMARLWAGELQEDPDGRVARMLNDMLRLVARSTIERLDPEGDGVETKEVATLARALKDLAQADKATGDLALRIRRELVRELEEKVDDETEGGRALTPEALKEMIREVYGG